MNFAVLVTSGTVTSAALAEQRLPPGAVHQFIPLDMPQFVGRFPRSLAARSGAVRRIRSVAQSDPGLRRARHPDDPGQRPRIGALVQPLAPGAGRDRGAARPFRSVSCAIRRRRAALRPTRRPRISSSGNLKLDVPAPPADQRRCGNSNRSSACAPSSPPHPRMPAKKPPSSPRISGCASNVPSLLTVIAPRHPDRGSGIVESAKAAGLAVGASLARRSAEARHRHLTSPTRSVNSVWSIGSRRSCSWAARSPATAARIRSRPIRLGAAVVHGPNVWNFAEIYATLDAAHGAERIADEEALTACLADWLARSGDAKGGGRCSAGHGRETRRCTRADACRARALSDAASARAAGLLSLADLKAMWRQLF